MELAVPPAALTSLRLRATSCLSAPDAWAGREGKVCREGRTGCKLPPAAQHGHPSTEREGEGGMGQRKAAGGGRMLPALLPP